MTVTHEDCNQNTNKRKEAEINNIKVEMLFTWESAKHLGQKKYISATGDSRDQTSKQSGLGIVLQVQTRADIKIVLPTTQTPLVQHGDHADAELCLWNLDATKKRKEWYDRHTATREKIKEEHPAQQKC